MTLNHWWDVMQSNGTYASTAVLGNTCTYDPALGLKTSSSFWVQNPQNTSQFLLQRTETYGYDPNLDYLTSASYNDGLPNANPSWSYDAAGNRTDAVCDNLNRATSIGGVTCTSDILGNRLTTGSNSCGWDALNRMTSMNSNAYQYRADGMRIAKTVSGVTTRYRYDGQMGMEDSDSTGVVRRYGLGARGIDFIENPAPSGGWVAFPVYDAHGNMVATLARNGGSYSLGNQRSFDAWGNVRLGSGTGDPSGRYCGNLGHKQDDESGLIYMRARCYEAASGRFISEDPGRNWMNWFAYCDDNPISCADDTGKGADWDQAYMQALRTEWRFALRMSAPFHHVADAFLTLWYAWLATDLVYQAHEGDLYFEQKAWRYLGELTSDRIGIAKDGGIKNAIRAFYEGYSACLEISFIMIIEVTDEWGIM